MTTMTKRWIKIPGPGEFRGEGEWCEMVGNKVMRQVPIRTILDGEWKWIVESGYLPTHIGVSPPDEGETTMIDELKLEQELGSPRRIMAPDGTVVGYLYENDRYRADSVFAIGDDPKIQNLLDRWYENYLEIKRLERQTMRRIIDEDEMERVINVNKARAALGIQPIT